MDSTSLLGAWGEKLRSVTTWRQLQLAAVMLPILAFVHVAAYWLRFEGELGAVQVRMLGASLSLALLIKTPVFLWYRIYQGLNRYITTADLSALMGAATVSSMLCAATDYLLLPDISAPRSVFLMDWVGTIVAVGGVRAGYRLLREHQFSSLFVPGDHRNALIVGANDSGEHLLRAIRRSSTLNYRVVGFLTDDRQTLRTSIGGVPVIGMLDDACKLAAASSVEELLITAGELSGQQVRQLVEQAGESSITVKVLPSYEQLINGDVNLQPRSVSIEDLLQRDPVQLDQRELHQWIDHHTLLVTGSAGSIGSEICRQLLQFAPRRLVVVDQSETGQFFLERELRKIAPTVELDVCIADVTDHGRMNQIFAEHQPDIVFHAAAYKHVPLMEHNPGEAVKNIPIASSLLADLAHRHRVKSFVMISTDKAVNPTSVMGACKRVAELYVQSLAKVSDCRFVTVRFGNVLDSAGSVIPIFREQILRGGPVTVTHPDMRRFFMTIPEASQLVIQAGAMGNGGEIFVLDMGEPVRIVDLATDMIRLSGLTIGRDIEIDFVGVRPGEKLWEELHISGETHQPTAHPKIQVVQSLSHSHEEIAAAIDRLARRISAPKPIIIHELQQLVPEFVQPSHTDVRRAA